ncbi:hypothetical protein SpCBS45565_g06815 [Spizellomyces sp. 'palustris']|nr:hypothetical protein SpCBS45565_g06815 [Spizellomyces sp. 'palustris']
MTRLAALVCLSLAAAGSVTAQSGQVAFPPFLMLPKEIFGCELGMRRKLSKSSGQSDLPIIWLRYSVQNFATCNCEAFAEYPTREALIAVCPSIWGEGNKDNYPKFKEACASGAYNNVLTALKYRISVPTNHSEYFAPFLNAEGKVVSGSSAPVLANDAGKLANELFAAAVASVGMVSLILTVM